MDIRNMSEDELLDLDYFLNEDDLFNGRGRCRRLLYLLNLYRFICMPASVRAIFVQEVGKKSNFPIKQKKLESLSTFQRPCQESMRQDLNLRSPLRFGRLKAKVHRTL